MSENTAQQHDTCMRRFIALANEMRDSGVEPNVVSWALMTASGIYSTYSVAGNDGGLTESGIDRVADAYKRNLATIQEAKKNQAGMSQAGTGDGGATEPGA